MVYGKPIRGYVLNKLHNSAVSNQWFAKATMRVIHLLHQQVIQVNKVLAIVLMIGSSSLLWARPALTVERFDRNTWQRLTQQITTPTVVVFSATYCTHCPAVIAQLALSRGQWSSKQAYQLIVVVMDGDLHQPINTTATYREVDRWMVFDGAEQALRFGVNREWRGLTPYVALLAPRRPPQFVTGAPSAEQLRQALYSAPSD